MLFNLLSRKILNRNKKLYNTYQNQTCYLLGNGYSIKYLDLKNFKNLNIFSTGLNYLHKDFKNLKVIADFHLHPGIFSPIWRHPYSKKIVFENKTREFLMKTNRIPKENNFFTSIYNYPFLKKQNNIFFLNNFKKNFDLTKIDPSSEFTLMMSSLHAMIGIGVYMGFKKFIFVGMDYLSSRPMHGHFYEFGVRNKVVNLENYIDKIKILTNFFSKNYDCNFFFLSSNNSTSSLYENVNYEIKFNTKEKYKENFELINPEILENLSRIEFEYLIYEQKKET